ncbi:hypothetical protein N4T20_05400 [Flavobacterium sp. TR2]|uniref:hypothetical protein n=1 Tax=Flavobacterium sp. TR2 TaxID=2977321 RepID=UPI0021B09B49|nr:hypothetical protein [Flavobacterium sp. TR2]UWY29371.1 hypothetical protein N4T20_05400 [Flavobacterium sp. TR2]
MSTLLEDLKKYFKETPKEQIKSDWAKSEKYDEIGPAVDEFIEYSRKYYAVESLDANGINQVQITNIINNPKSNFGFHFFNSILF